MKANLLKTEDDKYYFEFERESDGAKRCVVISQDEVYKIRKQTIELLDELTFDKYQTHRRDTDKYNKKEAPFCHTLGLCSEAGEVAGKVDKLYRKTHKFEPSDEQKKEIAKELGDVLWFLVACADDIGYSLSEIAEINLDKLADRDKRDKICGEGDNR